MGSAIIQGGGIGFVSQASIEKNQANTTADNSSATDMESTYSTEIHTIRRTTDVQFRETRRQLLNAHATKLNEERQQSDVAVAHVREEAQKEVDGQREACEALAPELVAAIAERLNLS